MFTLASGSQVLNPDSNSHVLCQNLLGNMYLVKVFKIFPKIYSSSVQQA